LCQTIPVSGIAMTNEIAAVVGTAVTVAAIGGAGGLWVLRAIISTEVTPRLSELSTNAALLAQSFGSYREAKDTERVETRAILADLNKIVQDHETRIRDLEPALRPTVAMRPKRKRTP